MKKKKHRKRSLAAFLAIGKRMISLLSITIMLFSFFCGCSLKAPGRDPASDRKEGQGSECKAFYYSARRVYDAAINVYTGELISIELYEKGVDIIAPTYAIKVKVNEVLKGDLQPEAVIKDLCPAGFQDLGCDYLFMTGVDPAYGYDSNTYQKADHVYSGKVLKKELYRPTTETLTALYKITVEVKEVMKGDLRPGEIFEDVTSGRQEEIRDDVIFMTAKNDPYLGQYRLNASWIIYNNFGNPYSMVKLPGDNRVEYTMRLPDNEAYKGFDHGIAPPKTEDELMQQIQTPLENDPYIPFIPGADGISVSAEK